MALNGNLQYIKKILDDENILISNQSISNAIYNGNFDLVKYLFHF